MKQSLNILGGVLGLLVFSVLVFVLIATFNGLQIEQTPITFQSPLQSPTPSKNSTATPVPVLVSTPTREIFISPLPTPSPTPKPTSVVTVVPGPLPPGLKVVVAEGLENEKTSVIWVANVNDLTQVQIIKKFPSPRVDLPGGYISPDGKQMAYIFPGKSVWEGTLGLMNVDGSNDRIVESPVFGWGTERNVKWSNDGQWLAYLKMPFTPDIKEEKIEIWLVKIDTLETRLLTTVEPAIGIYGWSNDDTKIYYSFDSKIWEVGVNGKEPPVELFSPELGIYSGKLSPDNQKFLYILKNDERKPQTLNTVSLDGKTQHDLASEVGRGDFAFKWYQPNPIWSPDSKNILYNIPVSEHQIEFRVDAWDKSKATTIIPTRKGYYYRPLSWSPDGQVIAAAQRTLTEGNNVPYPRILIYPNGKEQEIYKIELDFIPLKFIGWLDDRKGGMQ